jgi:hypothetical protein
LVLARSQPRKHENTKKTFVGRKGPHDEYGRDSSVRPLQLTGYAHELTAAVTGMSHVGFQRYFLTICAAFHARRASPDITSGS